MGCGCGKSFSSGSNYATGMRTRSSHIPNTRPVQQAVSIQSKSLQAKTVQVQAQAASSGRRKV